MRTVQQQAKLLGAMNIIASNYQAPAALWAASSVIIEIADDHDDRDQYHWQNAALVTRRDPSDQRSKHSKENNDTNCAT
jgi:hypothetical protein